MSMDEIQILFTDFLINGSFFIFPFIFNLTRMPIFNLKCLMKNTLFIWSHNYWVVAVFKLIGCNIKDNSIMLDPSVGPISPATDIVKSLSRILFY